MKELDALASQHPQPAGVERLRGTALYLQGDMQDSQAAFARAMEQEPADHESAEMRGVALFRLGKAAEAVPLLEAGKGAATGANIDGNYVLALCYMDTRKYDQARVALAAQYGFPPEAAEAYLLAARLLFRREYTPAAEEAVHKATVLTPNLPLAHELLGEIALAKGELPASIAEFEHERAINPLYGGIYDRLGDAYTRMGDYAKAQQALNRAVLLEPNATGPYILLGKVLLKQRNAALAGLYLEHAVHMDPGNYIAHSLLGQAYRAAGRTAEAQRETEAGEKIQAAATPKFDKP
jgi:predicted Zn-dependent protease